tara:strand:- start:1073 stop:1735 length:663 start_codon:yes stop_codon:yes gene_type:complete
MGQNSTEVAYGFGQLGSAYSDLAQVIVPPKDHVIIAIQFLADNTPTVLTPEKLDKNGPGYIAISGSTGDDIEVAGNNYFNFNGVHASHVTNGSISAGSNVTLATSGAGRVRVGQYVLLVNDDADESGATLQTIDTAETPIPIYNGPSKQGCKVESFNGTTTVTLDCDISPSSQALIFLDEYHGAGGLTAASQVFPKGLTIYGRWTAFKPSAAGVICYFGK